jgi:hypothetical protein
LPLGIFSAAAFFKMGSLLFGEETQAFLDEALTFL